MNRKGQVARPWQNIYVGGEWKWLRYHKGPPDSEAFPEEVFAEVIEVPEGNKHTWSAAGTLCKQRYSSLEEAQGAADLHLQSLGVHTQLPTDQLIERLEQINRLASPRPWEQHYGYNNGGCPTGFLKIPGHNQGKEVEMLAEDTAAITDLRNYLPDIIHLLKNNKGFL